MSLSSPWKVDTFKVSTDPDFEKKLVDVVGLYLNPPARAVVFSFDEKTQGLGRRPRGRLRPSPGVHRAPRVEPGA
jgi:hypothetical protein